MELSVVVPVYNMAEGGKLEYCLNSLMGQTVSDYEVIAVNDASTDNSLEILRRYEKQFPDKMRVITYPDNRRQGGAKNQGIKAARGEWLGFVDSDDWIAPDYFEKLLNKAHVTGADMVGCDYCLVDRHTMGIGRVVHNNQEQQTGVLDEEKHRLHLLCPGSMVVKIYRTDVIRGNQLFFPEGIFYEDNCAGPLWSLYFTHFERVDEPLYYYYQHSVSTVHDITEEKCRDRMKAEELLYEECRKRGYLEKYYPELEYKFSEVYYCNTLFSYMSNVKKKKLSFIRKLRKGIETLFPNFRNNSYYLERIGKVERELIGLQAKSDILFWLVFWLRSRIWNWGKRTGE